MDEKKYIELEAALKANCYFCSAHLEDDSPCVEKCADYMKFIEIPSADVREVKSGKWIKFPEALAYKNAYSSTHIVCSACEAVFDVVCNHIELFNFCPNCGAEMEEL